MEQYFNIFLITMAVIAVVVFIALQYIKVGYGIFANKRWGPAVNNRLGWILMESPVFIAMTLLWASSSRTWELAPLCLFVVFQTHYLQRSFIFPLLIKNRSKMPLSIVAMGATFNLLNALMQGGWIFYVSSPERYPDSWLTSPQFIIGALLFFVGMAVNIHCDKIIRNLRAPGDTGHYIPRGGMFRYVSSANYFGEVVEWIGFAVMCWSWAGAVFALWTFANLAPRAASLYKNYEKMFGKEFTSLHRKRILPFIY